MAGPRSWDGFRPHVAMVSESLHLCHRSRKKLGEAAIVHIDPAFVDHLVQC